MRLNAVVAADSAGLRRWHRICFKPFTLVAFVITAMTAFPLKLAVASKEGLAISEHFGHAKQFRIYLATAESCELGIS